MTNALNQVVSHIGLHKLWFLLSTPTRWRVDDSGNCGNSKKNKRKMGLINILEIFVKRDVITSVGLSI